MSDAGRDPAPDGAPQTADDVRAEIERTRAELGDTVNALADKVNVKAQAGRKLDEAKASVAEKAEKAHDAAPAPVRTALDKVGEAASVGYSAAEPYRKPIMIALAAVVLGALVWRRRAS